MQDSEKLTSKEIQLVNALLTSKTIREVSEKTGLSEATIYRYLKKEKIVNELEKSKRELTNNTLRYFITLGNKALNNIEELMNSKYERIRLEASKYVLNMIVKIKELQELEDRINRLEQIVEERNTEEVIW